MKVYVLVKDYSQNGTDWCPFGGWDNLNHMVGVYMEERCRQYAAEERSYKDPYPVEILEIDLDTGEAREILGG